MQRSAIKQIIGNLLMMAILLILAPGIGMAASGCDGAGNCYVRAGATGSGNGADWTNAYTTLPTSMTRGVTYYVAAGTYGQHTFSTADSGTTVITIQAATTGAHGTSTGWSDTYQGQATFTCSSTCSNIIQFSTDYWVFNGAYRTNWVSGYGFHVSNVNGNAGNAGVNAGLGYNGPPDFVHDVTVTYTEVEGSHPTSDSSPGVGTYDFDVEGGSYNILIDHDYAHDGYTAFYMRGNHSHQNGGGYVFGTGNGNTIQYTFAKHIYDSSTYHGEACSCSEGLTNFTIRYNYFVDASWPAGGTGTIATASGADYNNGNGPNGPWFIYGNIFYADQTNYCAVGDGMLALWDTTFSGNIYFLNNTIADLGASFCSGQDNTAFGFGLGETTPLAAVYSENNLWFLSDPMTVVPTGTTSWSGATMTSTTWSYNSYYQTPNGASSDPDSNKQVSTSNPFASSSVYTGLTLVADTTAGANTHSMMASTTCTPVAGETACNDMDMNGAGRAADGTWDRGAMQISSAAPNPPTNVTATAH